MSGVPRIQVKIALLVSRTSGSKWRKLATGRRTRHLSHPLMGCCSRGDRYSLDLTLESPLCARFGAARLGNNRRVGASRVQVGHCSSAA
jgi:hypothetical protein